MPISWSLFYDNALLYLHPDRICRVGEQTLSDEAIAESVEQNRLALSSPTAAFTEELMVNDPLNLMPLLSSPVVAGLGNLNVDLTTATTWRGTAGR